MSIVGTIHFAASVVASVVRAAVLWQGPKGGRRHRQIGWTSVVAMLTVNATAFMLCGLFGGFGPFHVAAVGGATALVFAVGSYLIVTPRARALEPFRTQGTP